MRRLIFPTYIALGISFFQIYIRLYLPGVGQHLTIAVTDIVIGLLLLVGAAKYRLATRSPVGYAMLFFAGVSLLSGIVNLQTDRSFDFGDFLMEYIRIVGLVAMVFLLPSVIRRVGHDRLAQSVLWVARLHAVLVCVDVAVVSPFVWSETGISLGKSYLESDTESGVRRAAGLFTEPSFFAVYMAVSLFYILQVERNTGARYIRAFDIVFFSSAMLVCGSVSATLATALFILALAMRSGVAHKLKVSIAVAVFAVLVGLGATTFQDTIVGRNLAYVGHRVSSIGPLGIMDSSGRQRLIGSSLLAVEVLKEGPLLGTGLGGTNLRRLMERYWQYDPRRIAILGLHFIPATVIAATGILGLLPFIFILGWILRAPETRLIGISLVAVAFMGGGAFEPMIWWQICLAVSIRGAYKRMARNYRQARVHVPREASMARA